MKKLISLILLALFTVLVAYPQKGNAQRKRQTTTVVSSSGSTQTVQTVVTSVVDTTQWDANPQISIVGNFMTIRFTKPPSGVVSGYTLQLKDDCAKLAAQTLPYSTILGECYWQKSQYTSYTATGTVLEVQPYMPNVYMPFSFNPVGTVYKFRISANFMVFNANGATVQYSKEFTVVR